MAWLAWVIKRGCRGAVPELVKPTEAVTISSARDVIGGAHSSYLVGAVLQFCFALTTALDDDDKFRSATGVPASRSRRQFAKSFAPACSSSSALLWRAYRWMYLKDPVN